MILLNRPYDAYLAGTIVQLPTSIESALIAQGLASNSAAGPVTPGAVNSGGQTGGRVGFAAAASTLVVTSALCTTESKVMGFLSNAAADTTALSITRILPANGSFTIVLNAAATAAVAVDWSFVGITGFTIRV